MRNDVIMTYFYYCYRYPEEAAAMHLKEEQTKDELMTQSLRIVTSYLPRHLRDSQAAYRSKDVNESGRREASSDVISQKSDVIIKKRR